MPIWGDIDTDYTEEEISFFSVDPEHQIDELCYIYARNLTVGTVTTYGINVEDEFHRALGVVFIIANDLTVNTIQMSAHGAIWTADTTGIIADPFRVNKTLPIYGGGVGGAGGSYPGEGAGGSGAAGTIYSGGTGGGGGSYNYYYDPGTGHPAPGDSGTPYGGQGGSAYYQGASAGGGAGNPGGNNGVGGEYGGLGTGGCVIILCKGNLTITGEVNCDGIGGGGGDNGGGGGSGGGPITIYYGKSINLDGSDIHSDGGAGGVAAYSGTQGASGIITIDQIGGWLPFIGSPRIMRL